MPNNEQNFLTVTELNRYIAYKFDSDMALQQVYVEGELSNVKRSGKHLYFSLKDENSELSGMFFYPGNLSLSFEPKDGDKVELVGKVAVYQKRGTYSINVMKMSLCGIGRLYEDFLKLKAKLEAEGLFDVSHKLPLPDYPKCVGIITASTGEAINDIISTFNRRLPLAKLKLFPCLVQGIEAPRDLVRALKQAYNDPELDVIIIGRGGGSFEDLNAFNDETLARLLYESKIPTVSAVGHEGDYTICDFVASFRAPTPTGAAMRLTKVKEEVMDVIGSYNLRLVNAVKNKLINSFNSYDSLTKRLSLLTPEEVAKQMEQNILSLTSRLENAEKNYLNNLTLYYEGLNNRLTPELIRGIIGKYEDRFNHLVEKSTILNPLNIIKKGYSIVYKDGEVVSKIDDLKQEDKIEIKFSEGRAIATIDELIEE